MIILATRGWDGYELLDSGNGFRFERFGKYTLVRPDPQAIWQRSLNNKLWLSADASFGAGNGNKERWIHKNNVPDKWLLHYRDLRFWAKLSPFKHTGVFPEQALQWDWIKEKITEEKRTLNILNLFGYTGITSLVAASCNANVTHVDASKQTIAWARENQAVSQLQNKPIRWIVDDAIKFTQREVKRGIPYDGIIMDPPVYGHGPHGETWNFSKSFPLLVNICREILSDKPKFILINAYAVSASALMLENILLDFTKGLTGKIEVGELALQEKTTPRLLSTGIFGRWSC